MSRDLPFGGKIGQFELLDEIGRGGTSTVYRARQISIERIVAVKLLNQRQIDGKSDPQRVIMGIERAARLEHPHILPIYDYGIIENTAFIAMRYMPGETLYTRVGRGSFYTMPELANPARQIASAIDYMHAQGMIHGDIKPKNILLDEHGNAYLSDTFAYTVFSSMSDALPGAVSVGSPAYMAPEQWRGDDLHITTDIYNFGATLYEMLSGRAPFTSETMMGLMMQHLNETVPSLANIDASLAAADPIFARALAKSLEQRYTAAVTFVGELTDAIKNDNRAPAARTTTSPARQKPSTSTESRRPAGPGSSVTKSPPPAKTAPDLPDVRPMRVFVSYAVVDSAIQARLVDALRRQQHSVWFDGLLANRGGQRWWDDICEQIRTAELFVFALSENSLKSVACQREYEYAHALHKRILPVKIADFNYKIDLPQALSELQIVDFTNGATSLAHSIANLPDARQMPDPPPDIPPVPVLPVQEFANELRMTPYGELDVKRQQEILMGLEMLLLKGDSVDDVIDLLERTQHERQDWAMPMHKKIQQMIKEYKPRRGLFGFGRGKRS